MLEGRLRGQIGALALDAAFTVQPGVTALLGASGAGKTSLLRAIAGLLRFDGEVRIGGEVWQADRDFVPPHRRGIGFVFQGGNLLPHLDVGANLAYAARRAEAPLPIKEVVTRAGIAPLLGRRPATLSGGEAQRVALARALLIRPKLLLLDEPFSALDRVARAELATYLDALLPGLSIPVLLVTHDRDQADRLADRQLVMTNGKLVSDPIERPADART